MPKSQADQLKARKMPPITFLVEAKLTPVAADEADGDAPKKGLIKATATTFGPRVTEDGRKFFYTAEAFSEWADEYNKEGYKERPLPMMINHVMDNMPVGEWTKVELTDDKMMMEGRIFTETSDGMDLMKIMELSPNMMGGVSISPTAEAWRMVDEFGEPMDDLENDSDGYFQITKGGMSEVSIVMHPANAAAEITSLELLINGQLNPRYVERALKEKGVPKASAVMAAGVFKTIYTQACDAHIRAAGQKSEKASESAGSNDESALIAALEERALLKRLNNWSSK